MILWLYQAFKNKNSKYRGALFKFLFCSKDLIIGENFQCDKFPNVLMDKSCKIIIGDNVFFRKDVEIRAHKSSKITVGNNVRIDRGVRFLVTNNSIIDIKEGARIGLYSVFNGGDSITVGRNALISGFVYLQTSMHEHKKTESIQAQGFSHAPIVLEEDSWLGAHVVVLPGCNIGKGSIVGSNAVVTQSIEMNKIYGGIPAKLLKER